MNVLLVVSLAVMVSACVAEQASCGDTSCRHLGFASHSFCAQECTCVHGAHCDHHTDQCMCHTEPITDPDTLVTGSCGTASCKHMEHGGQLFCANDCTCDNGGQGHCDHHHDHCVCH